LLLIIHSGRDICEKENLLAPKHVILSLSPARHPSPSCLNEVKDLGFRLKVNSTKDLALNKVKDQLRASPLGFFVVMPGPDPFWILRQVETESA